MTKTIFEQMGGTYTMQGDYYLPKKNAPSASGHTDACGI